MKDNRRCRECAYQTRLSTVGDEPVCFYSGITGKSRMLRCPAGDECTVFKPLGEEDIDRRQLFFEDSVITYGWCEDWHKEERKNEALFTGFHAYSNFDHRHRG